MLLHLGACLASSHTPSYTWLPNVGGLSSLGSPNSVTNHRRRSRLVRRLQNSTPRRLHPVDSAPEGVPSSLFTFRPKTRSSRNKTSSDDGEGGGDATTSSTDDATEPLQAGLVDESDLKDVSVLLNEVFSQDITMATGEFSELETVVIGTSLDMTNKYLRAVAYNEVFYSLKSRCGDRLTRGDFALTSEAVVLAVRDRPAPSEDGGDAGGVIAMVELSLREPDGSLPWNLPFSVPWRRSHPAQRWEPYLCNLAVVESRRGKGYGKQLVRLCEHIAKNHWGYERMYLHVDMDDPVATRMYSSMGYDSMEQYDAPSWMRRALGMPTIRYHVKKLKGRRGASAS